MGFAQTSTRGDLLMLFSLCCVCILCKNEAMAASICNGFYGCLQSCHKNECKDSTSCLGRAGDCVQKGYGLTGNYKLHCTTPYRCFQVCSLGSYEMICDESKTCSQQCHGSHCNATCNGKESCNQECHNGDCVMDCSSRKCYQHCYVDGCTAKCTSDVEECTQVCHANQCSFGCDAKSCVEFTTNRK